MCRREQAKADALTPRRRATLLVGAAKQRAKKAQLRFSIDNDWVEARINSGICAVTGIEFDLESTVTYANPWSPSLDRINPNQGYTKENTQVVVWIYNAAKGQYTHEDVLTLCESLMQKEYDIVD